MARGRKPTKCPPVVVFRLRDGKMAVVQRQELGAVEDVVCDRPRNLPTHGVAALCFV